MMEAFFAWLGGAGLKTLARCPDWEIRKHSVFGATVLVPTLFGAGASGYAAATLTSNLAIITSVALVWGFVILTIDRAFLVAYRPSQPSIQRVSQFLLRFGIAVLMGMTIAHPLTMLLFAEGIDAEIQQGQTRYASDIRAQAQKETANVDTQIAQLQTWQTTLRAQYQDSFKALVGDATQGDSNLGTRLTLIDQQIAGQSKQRELLLTEVKAWQTAYSDEIDGKGESRMPGIGREARRIRDDELAWRQSDVSRLSESLAELSTERNRLLAAANDQPQSPDQQALAAAKAKTQLAELEQQEKSRAFLREDLQAQIAAISTEFNALQTQKQTIKQRAEQASHLPISADLISRTLALHRLFHKDGGHLALIAYVVLSLVFVILDTIPMVVKFSAKPGPYDLLVEHQEANFQPIEGEPDEIVPEEEPPKLKVLPKPPPRWKSDQKARGRLHAGWARPSSARKSKPKRNPASELNPKRSLNLAQDHVVLTALKLAEIRQVLKTNAELAKAVGIKPATVSKYFKLAKLPEQTQTKMLEIPSLSLDAAYRIACVPDDPKRLELLKQCQSGLSQRHLRLAITELKAA